MTTQIITIDRGQLIGLRLSGLELREGVCVTRVLTRCPADVEKFHNVVQNPDAAPDFINGQFRLYAVMEKQS